jgi:hypothetical protein
MVPVKLGNFGHSWAWNENSLLYRIESLSPNLEYGNHDTNIRYSIIGCLVPLEKSCGAISQNRYLSFTTENMACVVPLLPQTAIHLDLPVHITCCSSLEHGICCPFTITNFLHLCQFCSYILSVADLGPFLLISHVKLKVHPCFHLLPHII